MTVTSSTTHDMLTTQKLEHLWEISFDSGVDWWRRNLVRKPSQFGLLNFAGIILSAEVQLFEKNHGYRLSDCKYITNIPAISFKLLYSLASNGFHRMQKFTKARNCIWRWKITSFSELDGICKLGGKIFFAPVPLSRAMIRKLPSR